MIQQAILVDIIQNIKGSVIQHGSHNNRIYNFITSSQNSREAAGIRQKDQR